jgi:hypothetical protein
MTTMGGAIFICPLWPTIAKRHITPTAKPHCGRSNGKPSTRVSADLRAQGVQQVFGRTCHSDDWFAEMSDGGSWPKV